MTMIFALSFFFFSKPSLYKDWGPEDTDVQTTAAAAARGNPNLWEESWDDDDVNEDFAVQLK